MDTRPHRLWWNRRIIVKKVHKRIGIILALVILFLIIGSVNVYNFNNDGLDSALITGENGNYYEIPISIEKLKPNIVKRKNYFLSNFFIMTYSSQLQIRFRIVYPIPFMHNDIFTDTGFYLQDSEGNDLTHSINTYSETFMGCNGLNITLIFTEDTYMPKSGERLSLTVASSQETNVIDAEKSYSYSKMEIVIP